MHGEWRGHRNADTLDIMGSRQALRAARNRSRHERCSALEWKDGKDGAPNIDRSEPEKSFSRDSQPAARGARPSIAGQPPSAKAPNVKERGRK